MKKQKTVWFCAILAVVLASCNGVGAKATASVTSSATSVPIMTNTPQPTATLTQTAQQVPDTNTPAGAELPLPSGEPLTEWEGFPIMPGAIAGDGDNSGYSYIIDATVEEIQSFYAVELEKLGWTLLASGEGTTKSILMMYTKNGSVFTITIISRSEGVMYILLVK